VSFWFVNRIIREIILLFFAHFLCTALTCVKEVCELRVLITLILLQTFILIFPFKRILDG
jgi:hypothetical protein